MRKLIAAGALALCLPMTAAHAQGDHELAKECFTHATTAISILQMRDSHTEEHQRRAWMRGDNPTTDFQKRFALSRMTTITRAYHGDLKDEYPQMGGHMVFDECLRGLYHE